MLCNNTIMDEKMASVGIDVQQSMPINLARALNALDIGCISLLNEDGDNIRSVLPKEHAITLFSYLDLAGYLSPDLFNKAIDYLSKSKPFDVDNDTICNDFSAAYEAAHKEGTFDVESLFKNFFGKDYFKVNDIVDLIVFLQQTAFDRKFGVERDKLQAKSWLEKHGEFFRELATSLGVVTALPPRHKTYCGTAIMGAASARVKKRIEYFKSLSQDCGEVWALSGNRELSKGLDEEDVMDAVATAAEKPILFVTKGEGLAARDYLDHVTETMMVNYLLLSMNVRQKIAVIDSKAEEGHWRVTTAQGAKDIAKILVQKIKNKEMVASEDGIYRFMIIAEQPYAGRMAKQVQRAFSIQIASEGLSELITIKVEGVGPGIKEEDLSKIEVLTRINSDLGALMAERYTDARSNLLQEDPNLTLRDSKILMFSTRDEHYRELTQAKAFKFSM